MQIIKSLGYSTSTSRIYHLLLSSSQFFMNSSTNLDTFFPIQNHLPVIFETLPIHANCLHLNTSGMMIQCFYYNFSYTYYLLLHTYILHDNPPLIPFSTIINISLFVNNSNFTPVFFEEACHANPGADKKLAGSSSYISILLFIKFSHTSASYNVSYNVSEHIDHNIHLGSLI